MAGVDPTPWWEHWLSSIGTIVVAIIGTMGTVLVWVMRDRNAAWEKIIKHENDIALIRAELARHFNEADRRGEDLRGIENKLVRLDTETAELKRRLNHRGRPAGEDD